MSEQIPEEPTEVPIEAEEPGTDTLPDGLEIPPGGSLPEEGSQEPTGQPEQPAGQIPGKPEVPGRPPLPPVAADAVARAFQQRFERPNRPIPDGVATPKGQVTFYQVEAAGNVVKAWIEPIEEEGKEPDYVVVNGPTYVEDPDGDLVGSDGRSYRLDPVAAIAEAIAADREAYP